jgi:hypothetical protein
VAKCSPVSEDFKYSLQYFKIIRSRVCVPSSLYLKYQNYMSFLNVSHLQTAKLLRNSEQYCITSKSMSTKFFVPSVRFCKWFSEAVRNDKVEVLLT